MFEIKNIILLVVVVVIVGSVVFLEGRKTKPQSTGEASEELVLLGDGGVGALSEEERQSRIARKERSSEYSPSYDISTPDAFINTDPFKIEELIGKKVILVDFWTYSCINCQRTLPYLNSWHEKYGDKGLVVVGVHTPEFEFEKEYENVLRATEKFGVEYPVVLDNDYSTWRSYKNKYWPRKYIIDIDGFVAYDHIGEGAYDETEKVIVELLNERSETLGEERIAMIDNGVVVEDVDFSKVRTPETYLGYSRIEYLANLPNPNCGDIVCTFTKPEVVALNTYALSGKWKIGAEEARLSEGEGEIIIRFSASKVNLVAGAPEASVRAEILLDGKRIEAGSAGDTVEDGFTTFTTHDLYNLVDLRGEYGEHELIIRFLSPGVEAFAFTFG